MITLDDTGLQKRFDTLEALMNQLIEAHKNQVPADNTAWTQLYHDDFTKYPLGDLPTVWQAGFPWVGANQAGAFTSIENFQGKNTMKATLTNAYHNAQGARAFWLPNSPRWDYTVPYVGKILRFTYKILFPKALTLEPGTAQWTSAGLEVKADGSGNATVATNLITESDKTFFALQHLTTQIKPAKIIPIVWNEWINADLRVKLAKDDTGYSELRLGDGTYIKSPGYTVNKDNGGAGIALCLYGNNIIGGNAVCYFDQFNVEVSA